MNATDLDVKAPEAVGHVLVVEEEPEVCRVFRDFLTDMGHEVTCCCGDKDAENVLQKGDYDVVLMEFDGGSQDGQDTLDLLQRFLPDAQVVLITGFTTVECLRRAMRYGVKDVIEKPVDLRRLAHAVKSAIEKRDARAESSDLLRRLAERNRVLAEEVRRVTLCMERYQLEDEVTGLPGYQALRSYLEAEIGQALRNRAPLALVMLDVDRFAEYNLKEGCHSGRTILRSLASLIRGSLRGTDALFRYASDQFAVVLTATGGVQAQRCVVRLQDLARSGVLTNGGRTEITMCAGVAVLPDNGTDFEELVRAADRALDAARAAGSGQVFRA